MDKSQAKKYTKIATTLGVIAGGSALLIGLANLITIGPIKQNEINKKLESIKVVYGDDAKYGNENIIGADYKETYPSLISYYNAKDKEGKELGNVFVSETINKYGPIKIAIGVNTDYTFGKISVISHGQTVDAFMSGYVEPWNNGTKTDFDDVTCGATYAATSINTMGKEALSYYKNVIKNEGGDPSDAPEYLSSIYGNEVKYGEETLVNDTAYPGIKSYHMVSDKNDALVGYVFVLEGKHDLGSIKMSIGINADGTIGKLFLIENGQTNGFDKTVKSEFVDKYNAGERGFDDVNCGATLGATLINKLGKEAQTYYKGVINNEITDFSPYLKEIYGTEGVSYIRKHNVIDGVNVNLKEEWTAHHDESNTTLGRVYHADINNMHLMIGLNKAVKADKENNKPAVPVTIKKVYWVNATTCEASNGAKAFIETLANKKQDEIVADSKDSNLIRDIKRACDQAFRHAANNMIADPVDVTALLAKTFGSEVSYCEQTIVDEINNPNVMQYWNVKDANRKYIGRAYHMQAPGQHAVLNVLVGVVDDSEMGGKFYSVATDAAAPDKTANAAIQAYINGLNDGSIKLDSKDDVKGGATGTNTGIQNLAQIAVKHYGANMTVDNHLHNVFGNEVTYVDKVSVNKDSVRTYWNAINADGVIMGRVYHAWFTGRHATINALVGVTEKMDPKTHMMTYKPTVYLVNRANSEFGEKLQRYVDNINNGDISYEDEIHNGASASTGAVRTMIVDVMNYHKASPILPLLTSTKDVASLYGEGITLDNHRRVSDANMPNVVEYWTAKDAQGQAVSAAYHCAFAGKHAVMHITVSVSTVKEGKGYKAVLGKINLLNKAPNKYGEILQEYVDKLNNKEIDINDEIHNGASSSSGAVKEMVLQAMNHASANFIDSGMDVTRQLSKVFGKEANYGEKTAINDVINYNLVEYWDVTNADGNAIGRVYHGAFVGTHGALHVLIGVNLDGSLHYIHWANNPANAPASAPIPAHVKKYGKLAQAWIDKINNGEIKLTDDVHSGASATTGGIISLAEQSLNHYNANKISVSEGE